MNFALWNKKIHLIIGIGIIAIVSSGATFAADAYGKSDNVNDYLKSSDANASPGDLAFYQAKAIEECGIFIARPHFEEEQEGYLKKTNDINASYKIASLKRIAGRCADFSANTPLKAYDEKNLILSSSKKNNVKAEAILLRDSIFTAHDQTPSNIILKVSSIINTKDPEATLAISEIFGPMGPFKRTPDGIVGSIKSVYAWQIVACKEGLECGPESPIVATTCISMNICGGGDYQGNIQMYLSEEDNKKLIATVSHIESLIAAGNASKILINK